jgi:hypothetical protein
VPYAFYDNSIIDNIYIYIYIGFPLWSSVIMISFSFFPLLVS